MALKKLRSRDGAVLPAVLMFVVFSLIIGLAIIDVTTVENVEAMRRGRREAAFYLAESGLNWLNARIQSDPDWDYASDYNGTPIDNVRIVQGGSEGEYVSEVVDQAGQVVFRLAQSFEVSSRFSWAQGFVWLNEDIDEEEIYDYVHGYISPEDALKKGERSEYPDSIQMPPADWTGAGYSEYANVDGMDLHFTGGTLVLPPGDHQFRDIHVTGQSTLVIEDGARLFVDGDIQLPNAGRIEIAEPPEGQDALGVDIYVSDGRIQLPGEVATLSQDPADLRIYSNSTRAITSDDDDVKFPSHALFHGIIYAPDGQVDLVNHTEFWGAIVAHTIRGRTHTSMIYPSHLGDISFGDDVVRVKKTRWSKPDWEGRFR